MSIVLITLAYISGIIWGIYQEINVLICLLIFLLLFTPIFYKRKFNIVFIFLIICYLGAVYVKVKYTSMEKKYLEDNFDGEVTILTHAEISSDGYYYKYKIKNESNDKFILYLKKKNENIFDIGVKLELVNATFKMPDECRNKGGFNYRMYMYSNDIYGTIKANFFKVVSKETTNIVYIIQNKIRGNMLKIFDAETAGILNGMLIGETNDISDLTKENFEKSGITHLLAVSGANVMLVITISNYLFSKLVGRKYDFYFSISFIIIFTIVAGSSASVVRASIMAITNVILNLLLKKPNPFYNLSFSIFLILLINPISLTNVGLILSAVGTIGIISFSKDLNLVFEKWIKIKLVRETLSVTLAAQLALLPILAYYFNNISIVSIFANLFIVPIAESLSLISLAVFLLSLISIKFVNTISYVPKILVKYVTIMSEFFAQINFLNYQVPTPRMWMIAIYYILLFIYFKKLSYKNEVYAIKEIHKYEDKKLDYCKRLVYLLLAIILVLNVIYNFLPKRYTELSFIDVGQGDSCLVISKHGKKILIDGGGSETSDYNVGENVLLPYLLDRWIFKLDIVFVSHAHADHIEGLYTVLENIKVERVVISTYTKDNEYMAKLLEICKKRNVQVLKLYAGNLVTIDNIKFEILYPNKNTKDNNENNLSQLMMMTVDNTKVLFTGDLEEDAEEKIDFNINADVLKVSHHGSSTSTTQEFLNKVAPQISLISVAEDNSYGHPSNEVVSRIKKCSKIYMTKDSGEITLKIYKNKIVRILTFLKDA